MATSPHSARTGQALVLATIASHAPSLLGTARRYSLCADDAEDAYQRALEIFLRRADSVDPAHAVGWLRTVVKHEALAVRTGRLRLVGAAEADLDREEAPVTGSEERAAEREHAERGAEALQRLKPQEVRALVLKARGYSYREICEITGWTYTKVNRCLTEGRRAFLARYDDIASGRECERWAAVLSALADGEASAEDVAAVRPHLRACTACRATLRGFRAAPGSIAALAPVAFAAPGGDGTGVVARAWDAVTGALPERAVHAAHGAHERVALGAQKLQGGVEAASAGKLTAVAASATALAGGGVAAVDGARRAAPVAKVERRAAAGTASGAPRPRLRPNVRVSAPAMAPSPPRPTGRQAAQSPRSPASATEFAPEGDPVGSREGRRAARAALDARASASTRPDGAAPPSADPAPDAGASPPAPKSAGRPATSASSGTEFTP
jgi:RNA polymerase sigma factor (sigma-70 family)